MLQDTAAFRCRRGHPVAVACGSPEGIYDLAWDRGSGCGARSWSHQGGPRFCPCAPSPGLSTPSSQELRLILLALQLILADLQLQAFGAQSTLQIPRPELHALQLATGVLQLRLQTQDLAGLGVDLRLGLLELLLQERDLPRLLAHLQRAGGRRETQR
ncbi:hypothetical protein MC885_008388 [Smutsia gigantea]|nr:hypothetical protein MC885_008388 [Smutsia gigantea]